MKSVNNEQALLAVLLLLLTSLSTVSGSMPTIQSIETYFEELCYGISSFGNRCCVIAVRILSD